MTEGGQYDLNMFYVLLLKDKRKPNYAYYVFYVMFERTLFFKFYRHF